MRGKFELDWWRDILRSASDEHVEQATSGLHRELTRQTTDLGLILHDLAVAELGSRSRAEDRAQVLALRQLGSPPPLH